MSGPGSAVVPDPLAPIGLRVLYYTTSGEETPAWIVVPGESILGEDKAIIGWCSRDGWNWDYKNFDDSVTPVPDTWRYDPRFPVDAFPQDLVARLDTVEQAQADGATGYGVVAFHSAGSPLSLALTAGTYATLTGGALQGDSAGLTYDDSTGELLVDEPGVYLVSLSVSQSRLLGLTSTDATAAVFVDDAESVLRARSSLAALADTRTITAQAALRLDAGAVLTLRTRTTVGTTVQVQDFLLSLTWLAA